MCPGQTVRLRGQSVGGRGHLSNVVLHEQRERGVGKELQKPPGKCDERSVEEKSQCAEAGGAQAGNRRESLMALVSY